MRRLYGLRITFEMELVGMKEMFNNLEKRINYNFSNKELLHMALTHSSYANEHNYPRLNNNERLDFLGDAVLEITVSDFLYNSYTDINEGELSI